MLGIEGEAKGGIKGDKYINGTPPSSEPLHSFTSRHISLNFLMPATQATYRMCLLTAWCVRLLRSDCKSMRNWWVYEHLSPSYAASAGSLQAYAL